MATAMLETWTATAANISNYLLAGYYYLNDGYEENGPNSITQIFHKASKGPLMEPLVSTYNHWMSFADKRVENWPLMSQPWSTLCIGVAYLAMCSLGPRAMAPYKAFTGETLRPCIVTYNLGVAGLNLYIALELLATSRLLKFSWLCEPVNYSDDPVAVRIASALWWYYASKLIEMLDSVFFILKKKPEQLTFLHVYHHSTMFCLWWIGVKFVAGGSSFLGAMFNCFVHVLMYTYYLIAALGPRFKKYLWWKKYLTVTQMLQFFFAMVMTLNAIRIGCDFPMWMQWALVAYMVSFLVLFGKYFYNEYTCKRWQSVKQVDSSNGRHSSSNGNGFAKKVR